MACRRFSQQILVLVQVRQRCTAAAAAAAATADAPSCPFHFGKKRPQQPIVEGDLKTYESIPTPKGLPFIGTMFYLMKCGGAAKIHEYCDMRHQELGPIFREKLGAVEAVVLADQHLMSVVYTSEGRYPLHLVPEPWVMYNEQKGIKRGLFFMDGAQWLDRRKVLNHALLSPVEVAKYGPDFSLVVDDVINRWETLTSRNSEGIIPNLETELYNWSIETLGTIVFGRRLNCVTSPEQESEMHEFVHYVQKIFGESAKLSIIPPKFSASFKLPVWRRFVEAADNALRMAREYTQVRIAEIEQERAQNKDKPVDGILAQLMDLKDVTQEEIVNIVADLILAAADTTSHATQWALYLLAKNPECQAKLLEQINQAVTPGESVSEAHLDKIPYAMWIIKETLRLYPIASFLTRILPEDTAVGGYNIPAGKLVIMSQFTMGRNPEHFENPHSFVPERWRRVSTGEHQNLSKGCMPFGAGARSCIGKRIAELKMRLLIAKTVQKFQLVSQNDVNVSLRMITTPDRPIQIRLEKRQ